MMPWLPQVSLLLLAAGTLSYASESSGVLTVPPSQQWQGRDGPWSTFQVQIGSPPQELRLLPHSGESSIWAVIPEACSATDLPSCPTRRGSTFQHAESSTWQARGTSSLWTYAEKPLGYSANAMYGFDSVGLAWGKDAPTLTHQTVAGIQTNEFFLGALGLDARPFNFSSLDNSHPSVLGTLVDEGKVNSSSWAYTAGSYNNEPPLFGSLTFGGFDRNRFQPNDVTFPFGTDTDLDLTLTVQSITTSTSDDPLWDEPVPAFVDSILPQIWLPRKLCDMFEKTFGLTYDENLNLYFVSNQTRSDLQEANPKVTWNLAPRTNGGPRVHITMPYSSFDLILHLPSHGHPVQKYYFPIRRAPSASRLILGRAFLQNAYVMVDYDRQSFSVSQAILPSKPGGIPEDIVAIQPPEPSDPDQKDGASSGLSSPTIAGMSVGITAAVAMVGLALFLYRRRRKRQEREEATVSLNPSAELGDPISTIYKYTKQSANELDGDQRVEMPDDSPVELEGDEGEEEEKVPVPPRLLQTEHLNSIPVSELHVSPSTQEMSTEAPTPVCELPAEPRRAELMEGTK